MKRCTYDVPIHNFRHAVLGILHKTVCDPCERLTHLKIGKVNKAIWWNPFINSNICITEDWGMIHLKVRNYFSLRSRTPSSLLSNVVDKFQWLLDTGQVYIGKTKRHLTVRVREHGNSHCAIFDHLQLCSRCKDNFSCDRFKILDHGRDDFETTIKEALYIKNSSYRPLSPLPVGLVLWIIR